ncbi:Uncharacterized RNA pseudouridine synthase Cpar_0723 [Geodia barretti]|uniref:Uncharacterized RNA pseudouridine synthase Cpar_0723 n=1 Tax=Geodia barretti TaxID=519541 RepID=A0AA35X4J5_GEOBA|nr:Uncharacterized RNA pseudouridine synthase Cpar_0723 [Geodia barretti]
MFGVRLLYDFTRYAAHGFAPEVRPFPLRPIGGGAGLTETEMLGIVIGAAALSVAIALIDADMHRIEREDVPDRQARSRVDEITVNGRPAKLATRLYRGDRVAVTYREPEPLTAVPEEMALSILHEDAHAIVLDKPAGIVTHPGAGNRTGTLLNGVLGHCNRVRDAFPDEPVRPGVVHRLDKETSGVIIFAKSPEAHFALTRQFALRRVRKRYLAVLDGRPPAAAGTVDLPIGRDGRDRTRFAVVARGRPALTRYR